MAIIKFATVKGRTIGGSLKYIMKTEKTDKRLTSGINCAVFSAKDEMMSVKKAFGKTNPNNRQLVHIIQSFSPDENISFEQAHEIAIKLAAYFPKFQMVVATHKDTRHVHNHIIMNSVSFEDGKMFHQSAKEMGAFKEYSNSLCKAYGFSETAVKNNEYVQDVRRNEYRAANKGISWKFQLINEIELCMKKASSKEDFISKMGYKGYIVR